MRIGSLAIQRGDRTYFVEAGNGLLLPAGEGDLTFFKCPKLRGLEAEIFDFDARTLALLAGILFMKIAGAFKS